MRYFSRGRDRGGLLFLGSLGLAFLIIYLTTLAGAMVGRLFPVVCS